MRPFASVSSATASSIGRSERLRALDALAQHQAVDHHAVVADQLAVAHAVAQVRRQLARLDAIAGELGGVRRQRSSSPGCGSSSSPRCASSAANGLSDAADARRAVLVDAAVELDARLVVAVVPQAAHHAGQLADGGGEARLRGVRSAKSSCPSRTVSRRTATGNAAELPFRLLAGLRHAREVDAGCPRRSPAGPAGRCSRTSPTSRRFGASAELDVRARPARCHEASGGAPAFRHRARMTSRSDSAPA